MPVNVPVAIPFSPIRFDRAGLYEFRLAWNDVSLDPVAFAVVTQPHPPQFGPMSNLGAQSP
jgi:hypothetical protein